MTLTEWYAEKMAVADERVADWPLLGSPWPVILLIIGYLLIVTIGPCIITRPIIEGRTFMIVYNAATAIGNFYILVVLLYNAYLAGYTLNCQPVGYDKEGPEYNICCACYWYFVSKAVEFIDSILFVLRCKPRQLSFLHTYHHATMLAYWYIIMKWVGGGCAVYGAAVNSAVHVLMYYYYARTAAWPNATVWWKKYITLIQLAQFGFTLALSINMLRPGCTYPFGITVTLVAYMLSFILLFSQFYLRNYKTTVKAVVNGGHANGVDDPSIRKRL